MGTMLSMLARAVCQPLTWAMAFVFTASEASSLHSLGGGGAPIFGTSSDVAAQLAAALVCGVSFALAQPLRHALRRPVSCLVLGFCGVVPLLFGGADAGLADSGLACLLVGLSQVSTMGLTLIILLRLAECPSLQVRSMVVVASALNAVLVAALEVVSASVALVCVVAGAAALAATDGAGVASGAGAPLPRCRRVLRAPLGLILGFFVVAVSFSFLQSLLYQQSQAVIMLVVVGTKLGAAVLFALVLLWQSDTSYAMFSKLIITLATGGFLVFLAQGSYSPAASVFMATGYSLLEMTTVLLLADLASYASWQPLRLFAAFYLVETVGYASGCLALEGSLVVDPSLLRVEAAGLALLLLVCAVWVFNENRVNAFTWGTRGEDRAVDAALPDERGRVGGAAPGGLALGEERACAAGEARSAHASDGIGAATVGGGGAAVAGSAAAERPGERGAAEGSGCVGGAFGLEDARPPSLGFSERAALVAARCRLTERETEVLELFASGRSAAFIAELKFVTANTVRSHIKHIYAKCDVHSRQELISLIEATEAAEATRMRGSVATTAATEVMGDPGRQA